eukprot:14572458-Alexandrium_andersonii.AAC.1
MPEDEFAIMSCNVAVLRPHMSQLMATLNDRADPTTCTLVQEHSTAKSAASPLRKLAATKRLTALLGPVDPNAHRETAG